MTGGKRPVHRAHVDDDRGLRTSSTAEIDDDRTLWWSTGQIWPFAQVVSPHPVCAFLATPKFAGPAPIATASWHVNMLCDAATAYAGGWWLVRTRVEHARDGYSSQDMAVWGGGNQPVLVAKQSVAIFDQRASKL